ncbi:hypothetical protein TBS_25500 [Thermobispora bispora]|uniref:hypothetical protein n=1 Tax=Thermobispora bispora TaxID=2006 RepID=UPI0023530D5E|nr:hypothetical protein [Actinomycetales bacterium]MBX6166113.1 hypothetical protein [Thermobispora bispora]MDI9582473.1 hypothetical protein [Thermobispora sp.]
MLRRITALGLGLALLTACGGETQATGRQTTATPSSIPSTVTLDDAEAAFEIVRDLADAWRERDCAKIKHLTAEVERAVGERVCAAVRNGLPAPKFTNYRDPEFFLPAGGDDDEDPWFAALATTPSPAYFVFVRSGGRWRLALGPIPVAGDERRPAKDRAALARKAAVRARLVPPRHVTYLTDPAGLGGVRFRSGDPMRDLLKELVRTTESGGRLTADVGIEGTARTLPLPKDGALVFHTIRIDYEQRPGGGRPRYRPAEVRAFTGEAAKGTVRGTEMIALATAVDANDEMATVGMRRVLSGITAD